MLKTSKAQALKENASTQMDLAVKLAQDRKFRKQLLSAIGHGAMGAAASGTSGSAWPRRSAGSAPIQSSVASSNR